MPEHRDPCAILCLMGMLAFALLMASCTVTDSYDRQGNRIERKISIGPGSLSAPEEAVLVKTRGAGVAYGDGRGVLGYYAHETYRMPQGCGAIIFLRDAAALDHLPDLGGTCIMQGG